MAKEKKPGKDPAFLFFPGDWLGGTLGFTRHQKGAYIDLMIAQFNIGHLSLKKIQSILGESDFDLWAELLREKFVIDEKGLFYNERLDYEIHKRKNFTQSRRDNVLKRHEREKAQKALQKLNGQVSNDEPDDGADIEDTPINEPSIHNQFIDIDLLKEKVFLDKSNFVRVYISRGLTEDKVYGWLNAFNRSLAYGGTNKKIESEYRKHFGNWLNYQDTIDTLPENYSPVKNNANGKINQRSAERNTAGKPDSQIIPEGNRGRL